MDYITLYKVKANDYGWEISLPGFITFRQQILSGRRKPSGDWWWQK